MLQSIYTHAGCDEIGHPVWTLFDVSIHTPTQGVTCLRCSSCAVSSVSIHTPTQGVTGSVRTHRHFVQVSIHTPTQGVTSSHSHIWGRTVFQSTHPRRVWLLNPNFLFFIPSFNPHTHAGCDSIHIKDSVYIREFQSTHPRRVWLHPTTKIQRFLVSIHTPTQGVTSLMWTMCRPKRFQSTHPRRVWR